MKNNENKKQKKGMGVKVKKAGKETTKERGITLIALVITVLFSYDEKIKYSNSKGFLLTTI